MSLSEQAIQYLQNVKEAILAQPHSFIMSVYFAEKEKDAVFFEEILEPEKNLCGTAACIAGTLLIQVDRVKLDEFWKHHSIETRACQLLGVNDCPLFCTASWPMELEGEYFAAHTDSVRAQIAAKAIDRYIAGDFARRKASLPVVTAAREDSGELVDTAKEGDLSSLDDEYDPDDYYDEDEEVGY